LPSYEEKVENARIEAGIAKLLLSQKLREIFTCTLITDLLATPHNSVGLVAAVLKMLRCSAVVQWRAI